MIDEKFIFLGVALNLIGTVSYVKGTLSGKIKPNRVTWLLWALAPMIAFTAEIGQGVGLASLLTFIAGFSPLCVFIAGFSPLCVFIASFLNKKSYWSISKLDILCGSISILGIILWYLTKIGDIAILFSIIADFAAGVPTLIKSYQKPETESPVLYSLGGTNALITLFTIKVWNFAHFAFPLYIFLICLVLVILIKFKLGKVLSQRSH